jgi:hypothetical protein
MGVYVRLFVREKWYPSFKDFYPPGVGEGGRGGGLHATG